MPRPPMTDPNAKRKTFIVEEGFAIGSFDEPNTMVHGGDPILLTQAQAAHYQTLGAITFDMGAIFDEPTADNSEPDDDQAEDGTESEAKGFGTKSLGRVPKRSVSKD